MGSPEARRIGRKRHGERGAAGQGGGARLGQHHAAAREVHDRQPEAGVGEALPSDGERRGGRRQIDRAGRDPGHTQRAQPGVGHGEQGAPDEQVGGRSGLIVDLYVDGAGREPGVRSPEARRIGRKRHGERGAAGQGGGARLGQHHAAACEVHGRQAETPIPENFPRNHKSCGRARQVDRGWRDSRYGRE